MYAFAFVSLTAGGAAPGAEEAKEDFIASTSKKASTLTSTASKIIDVKDVDNRFVEQKENAAAFAVEHTASHHSIQDTTAEDAGVDADAPAKRLANPQEGARAIVSEYSKVVPPHTGHKKVLVTGGAGFIGSHTTEHLLARGDDVVIIDEMNDYHDIQIKESNLAMLRQKYPYQNRLAFYQGDICNQKFLNQIFREEQIEWVCHLAAWMGVGASIEAPSMNLHSNLEGTTQLLDMAVKYNVKNFVCIKLISIL